MISGSTAWREAVLYACREAGKAILEARSAPLTLGVEHKPDGSPVSVADCAAAVIIREQLLALDADIPVVCEEGEQEPRGCARFWLVDPLDGTREFLRGSDAFTVNVALIDNAQAVFGVVHVPVDAVSYWGALDAGAWRDDEPVRLRAAARSSRVPRVLVSPRELDVARSRFAGLRVAGLEFQVDALPGALKFCLLASGAADLYPRQSPSCGWDTAAGQAILQAAGGAVYDKQWNALRYRHTQGWYNPDFLAVADADFDWRAVLSR